MVGMTPTTAPAPETTVLHVGGLNYASEKAVVEHVLGGQPGVMAVEANPVAQTATVTYDPDVTSVQTLTRWVEDCGYHCAGQSVPGHLCDPLTEPHRAPAHDHAAVPEVGAEVRVRIVQLQTHSGASRSRRIPATGIPAQSGRFATGETMFPPSAPFLKDFRAVPPGVAGSRPPESLPSPGGC